MSFYWIVKLRPARKETVSGKTVQPVPAERPCPEGQFLAAVKGSLEFRLLILAYQAVLWQQRNAINVIAYKTDLYPILDARSSDGVQFYFSTDNTISLEKSTKLQLDYWYSTPFKYGLYEIGKPMSSLNISVKQSMFDDKLQLALLFNDVFNRSQLREYNSVENGLKQSYYEDNSNRFFRSSLIYTFGNDNTNVKQRAFGNEEEKERAN